MSLQCGDPSRLWPDLRALYLQYPGPPWLRILHDMRDITILELKNVITTNRDDAEQTRLALSRCRQLRSLILSFQDGMPYSIVSSIGTGCPLLQRLQIEVEDNLQPETVLRPEEFQKLVSGLHELQFLCLSMRLQLGSKHIKSLAATCPRLKALDLELGQMYLSPNALFDIEPFKYLELMEVHDVIITNPCRLMPLRKLLGLSKAWKRVFPELECMPSETDFCEELIDLSDTNLNPDAADFLQYESWTETRMMDADIEFERHDSPWCDLRRRLWQVIGYKECSESCQRYSHIWQSELECELLGWPVLPMEVYVDPVAHSTTDGDLAGMHFYEDGRPS